MRPFARLVLSSLTITAAAAALTGPATAHAASLPLPCVETGLLAPIGDCPPSANAPSETPAADPKPARRGRCADADLQPTRGNLDRLAKATLCLVNKERTRRDRQPVTRHRSLTKVASSYARQMVDNKFFDHVTPRGTTLTQRVRTTSYLEGLRRWRIGENLAWGTGTLGSPAQTVRAWMRSPGHRRNMLDRRFREIGIGVAVGIPVALRNAPTGATYAHVFGRRVQR
jgi:uncharacterized protein YkwD